jgi:hypothetical protein
MERLKRTSPSNRRQLSICRRTAQPPYSAAIELVWETLGRRQLIGDELAEGFVRLVAHLQSSRRPALGYSVVNVDDVFNDTDPPRTFEPTPQVSRT